LAAGALPVPAAEDAEAGLAGGVLLVAAGALLAVLGLALGAADWPHAARASGPASSIAGQAMSP
jgi:hypothetical protein